MTNAYANLADLTDVVAGVSKPSARRENAQTQAIRMLVSANSDRINVSGGLLSLAGDLPDRNAYAMIVLGDEDATLGSPYYDWEEVRVRYSGGVYETQTITGGKSSTAHGPAFVVGGTKPAGPVFARRFTAVNGQPFWWVGGGSTLLRGTITDVHGFDGDDAGDVTYDVVSDDGLVTLTEATPLFRPYGIEVPVSIALIDDVCLIDPGGDTPTLLLTTEKILTETCDGTAAYTYETGSLGGLNGDLLLIADDGTPLVTDDGNLCVSGAATLAQSNAYDRIMVSGDGEIVFDDQGSPLITDPGDGLVDPVDAFDFLLAASDWTLLVSDSDEAMISPLDPVAVAEASPTSVQSIVAQSASAGTPTGVYVKADGTQALSANWDAGNHKITTATIRADTDASAASPSITVGAAATPPGFYSGSGDLNVSVGGVLVSRWTTDPYFVPPDQGQTNASAIGDGTTVNGIECVAIGDSAEAWNASSAGGSVAIGYAANAGNGAVARNKTVAIGAESAATHNSAIAIGYQATASGANTIAIGAGVTASALGPVVGYSCTATGSNALGAFGYTAVAGQTRSFALGFASAISANDFVIGDRGAANTTPRLVGIGCAGTAFQNCAMWYIGPSWNDSTNATRQSDATFGTFYSSSNTAIPSMRLFNDTSRGYVAMRAQTTAPADAALNNGEMAFWINGSGNFAIKYKDGSGTVTTGSVALA